MAPVINYGCQSSCLLLACLSYSSTLPLHLHLARTSRMYGVATRCSAAHGCKAKLLTVDDYNWEEDDEEEGGVLLAR